MHTSPFSIRGTVSFSSSTSPFKSPSGQEQPKKKKIDMYLQMRLKIQNKCEKCDFYSEIKFMIFEYAI